jgi:hypothetical protein
MVEPTRDEREEPSLELPSILRRRRPGARSAERAGPALPAPFAATVTGLLVGAVGVVLTYGGLQACEVVRGTASCGGPGLLLLVAIVAVMAVVGAALLALLGVPDRSGLSALGTGIVCVVVLAVLLDVVNSVWMFLAVPIVGAAAYLVAWGVTSRRAEPDAG